MNSRRSNEGVSRPLVATGSAPASLSPAAAGAPAALERRWVFLILAGTVLLQLLSWRQLEGYQLADSVEYVERARGTLLGHEVLGGSSVRSFAFSALFVPLFALADLLGVEDQRLLMPLFRLGMMALGLQLVASVMRIGARLGGRSAGYAAGVVAGTNPIFLQYSVSPISGVAAALLIALGIEHLCERRSLREHFAGGLCLGLAFMFAYQTLAVSGALLALVVARDLRARGAFLRSVGGGFAAALLAQVVLDRVSYGTWGASIGRYVLDNVGAVVVRILLDYFGLERPAMVIYGWMEAAQGATRAVPGYRGDPGAGDLQGKAWYVLNFTRLLPLPVIALLATGLAVAVARPRWRTSLLVLVLLANAVVLSHKGSKSFRLWLPLLPMLAPLAGLGFAQLASLPGATLRGLRLTAGVLLLAAGAWAGQRVLELNNTRRFGTFWQAMSWVNERVAEQVRRGTLADAQALPAPAGGFGEGKVRVSSTYHWAVFLRESPYIHLAKLPYALDGWRGFEERERERSLAELRTLDWFIAHLPALTAHPELMAAVNEEFTVEAAFYGPDSARETGPVFVLRRRSPFAEEAGARTFFARRSARDDAPATELPPFGRAVQLPFGPRASDPGTADGAPHAALVGWRYETLPGSRHGWISYWWRVDSPWPVEWTIVDRITSPDERVTWQNDHALAYGSLGASELGGTVVRESHLVVAGSTPFSTLEAFRPLGGAWRRGERIPASLWLGIERRDPTGATLARLEAGLRGGVPLPEPGGGPTADGVRRSADELILVDRFLLPVHASARIPDDGGPDPDADLGG